MKAPNRPFCQNVDACASPRLSRHCRPCGFIKMTATNAAKRPKPVRSHCAQPGQCKAKSKSHCSRCARLKTFAERPDLLKRHSEMSRERFVELQRDPEFQAKIRAGRSGEFSRRHGIPDEFKSVVRSFRKKGYRVAEAVAIVRRDLVKGA